MRQITVSKNVAGVQGFCVVTPEVHGDSRGYFMETYCQCGMEEDGIEITFVKDNQSMITKGVPRRLYFQNKFPQTKLVRANKGSVFDVAVDMRKGSKTYGKRYGIVLSEENNKQLFIPRGFVHSFLVFSDNAEFCYKFDNFYHPNDEGGLAWNDSKTGIKWPGVVGDNKGSASANGYSLHGVTFSLSDQD